METQQTPPEHIDTLTPMWRKADVKAYLGVSETQFFRLLKEGMPAHYISARVLRFDPFEIQAWSRSRWSSQEPGDGAA